MFCLQSHYRKPLVFTFESLDNTAGAYNKLLTRIASIQNEGEIDEAVVAEAKEKFINLVGNDLNTSLGLTAVYDILKLKTNGATKLAILKEYDKVLSLDLLTNKPTEKVKPKATEELTPAEIPEGVDVAKIEELIAKRLEAKKNRDFALADSIREELSAMNVQILDTKEGTKWSVK